MVNRQIALLDKATIDQIAAGEVVERPVSVVKELVENSIDAGATAITIEIKNGGKSYIRITDDGCGIQNEQLHLAFLRHSTSKLRDAADLPFVGTLGFRGEALSSIAAVAHVEMITKTREELLGAKYVIDEGADGVLSEIGAPDGTTIVVSDLFFNTPARRGFLKSDQAEGNYIIELVERLALSHPQISFCLIANGKEKLKTAGNGSLSDAIYQIFGKEISMHLLQIDEKNEAYHISGFIGESSVFRGNRSMENFYVDHRYIKSFLLSHAIEEGYLGYLMQHQYPFCVMEIEPVGASVDVNVHPTKHEVRFYEEEALFRLIRDGVAKALTSIRDIKEVTLDVTKESSQMTLQKPTVFPAYDQNVEPFERTKLDAIKEKITSEIHSDTPYEKKYQDFYIKAETAATTVANKDADVTYEQATFLTEEAKKSHRIIGQVFDTYWLVEYDNKLFIIDQHAAHEKVLYERMMKQLSEKEMTSQQISPPIILSLSATEEDILLRYQNLFLEVGYEISHFGGKEYAITAIPANLYSIDTKSLFLSMLAEFANDHTKTEDQTLIKEKIASMSCKAAVKGNNRLRYAEIVALIDELLTLENPYHCPHGRPTIISLSEYELDKRFKRIV